MSDINLLYTDIINFNNNNVKSLLLNGSKILPLDIHTNEQFPSFQIIPTTPDLFP